MPFEFCTLPLSDLIPIFRFEQSDTDPILRKMSRKFISNFDIQQTTNTTQEHREKVLKFILDLCTYKQVEKGEDDSKTKLEISTEFTNELVNDFFQLLNLEELCKQSSRKSRYTSHIGIFLKDLFEQIAKLLLYEYLISPSLIVECTHDLKSEFESKYTCTMNLCNDFKFLSTQMDMFISCELFEYIMLLCKNFQIETRNELEKDETISLYQYKYIVLVLEHIYQSTRTCDEFLYADYIDHITYVKNVICDELSRVMHENFYRNYVKHGQYDYEISYHLSTKIEQELSQTLCEMRKREDIQEYFREQSRNHIEHFLEAMNRKSIKEEQYISLCPLKNHYIFLIDEQIKVASSTEQLNKLKSIKQKRGY